MVDASGRKVIGQKAADFDASFGQIWIRGFKEGETQLRILEPTREWWRYKEHYGGSKEVGYFPCKQDDTCVGCSDLSERVRKTATKYCFNAVAADGKVRVFKMGGRLKNKLAMREQRMGGDILQRRDIVIVRMGSGFSDTEYDYEWGDEYELDNPPDEGQVNDLAQVVTDAYYAIEDGYASGELGPEADDEPADHADDEPTAEEPKATKKTAAAKKTARPKARAAEPDPEPEPAKDEPDPEPEKATRSRGRLGAKTAEAEPEAEPEKVAEAAPESEEGEDEGVPAGFDAMSAKIRGMENDELRKLLDDNTIDYPPRAARPRLIAYAENGVLDGKIPPF